MHFPASATAVAAALVAVQVGVADAQAPTSANYTAEQIADGDAFRNISAIADQNIQSNLALRTNTLCTYDSADVRQEWRTLDEATRQSFTNAVTCLQNMAPQRMTADEAATYPGVKSRYDEYVATHINYTLNIHATADFFAWHRTFIHFLEKDLQGLCGYTGKLPYWNWADDAQNPQDSPVFAGDEYSMGSNGQYIAGRSDTYLAPQQITFPPGTGGGCVYSGPFTNYTVNLGPLDLPNAVNVNSSFEYNPHCLIRDLNPFFSQNYNTYTNVTLTVLDNADIENFQDLAQGYNSDTNKFGFHGGGHWVGGGGATLCDFHSSPADPAFFLHHGMVDRTWLIWQYLDIANRQDAIFGTSTLDNSPPSADMTLSDVLPFGFVADDQTFGDLMDTFAGPFCYRYV